MGCTQSAGNQVNNPTSNPVADAPKNSLPHTLQARYKLGEQIGEGGYSIVRAGTSNIDKKKVAVKIVKRQGLSQEDEDSLRSEVEILLRLRHPNIVQAFDFFEEVQQFYVILEYIDGGELFDRIVKKTFYNEKEARDLVCIVLSAIKYLHDKNIVHRDLKPENLLLTSKSDDANIKVADFGFATKVDGLSLTAQLGTPGYIAPEILSKKPYGKPVDMWSFGVILYILLGGYPPFHDENQKRLFNKIRSGDFQFHPEYWGGVSEEAKDLIRGLLTVDMKRRLTVDQALAHPWLKRSAEDLASHNLDSNLAELRKYQATKKFRAGVKAVMAINRMKNLINYDPDEDAN
jgi:calcium/calmodulin-dependent protein kinase I